MELLGKVKIYRNVLMIYQVNLFFFNIQNIPDKYTSILDNLPTDII
jgi:hypothetical protein